MNANFDPREAARFLRTLRVAAQTALAQDDLIRGRGLARPATRFAALAAKGPGDWRFPAAGLMSADGLVIARLLHDSAGAKVLALQAQGSAGLSLYALRSARVRLGEGLEIEGAFDRDGKLHVMLDEAALRAADLSAIEIDLMGEA